MRNNVIRFMIAFIMIMIILFKIKSFAVTDRFGDFKELKLNKEKNTDYRITGAYSDSNIAIIAIHGGKIEKGSSELAYELASLGNYNFYSFEGIKKKNNSLLHIDSTCFDEPMALDMVSKSEITVSIHGTSGKDEFTYVGGLDQELVEKIRYTLESHGFTVLDPPKHLAGVHKSNIVNRNARKKGVQLEISEGLRAHFLQPNGKRDVLDRYVNALMEALNATGI
ncbi:poly-gamma-glutamate hydrolase family protein [Alkaliphilus crotonatoxidans]